MAITRGTTRARPWTPPVARPGRDQAQERTRPWVRPSERPWRPSERPPERPWERPLHGAGEGSGKKYRPGLDGLRALAIAGVLLYHAGIRWMPGGLLGVDLFFVISGFLITSLLVAELQRSGRLALAGFYQRRARRLLPAVAVVLLVTTAGIALFSPHELARFRGDLVASLGYVTNWWFVLRHQSYFVAAGRPSPFQHLWSLAVEEQFYLLWPLGLLALWPRLTGSGRLLRIGAVALLGAALSAGWMAVLAVQHHLPYGADSSRVYFGTDTHASALLIGVAAAALLAGTRGVLWQFRPPREATALDAAGGVALLVVCWAMMRTSEFSPGLYRGGFLLFAVVAAVAVVAASRPGSMLESALGSQPLRWVGTRSYGLYLWHWPVFVYTRPQLDLPVTGAADVMLRLVLTVALAEASYRLVERPIRAVGMRVWLGAVYVRGTELAAVLRSAAAEARSRLPRLAARLRSPTPRTARRPDAVRTFARRVALAAASATRAAAVLRSAAAEARSRLPRLAARLRSPTPRTARRPDAVRTLARRVALAAASAARAAAMLRSAAAEARSRLPALAARLRSPTPGTAARRPDAVRTLARRVALAAASAARAVRAAPPWQPAVMAWILATILFALGFLSYRSGNAKAGPHAPAAGSHRLSQVAEGPAPARTPSPGETPTPAPSAFPIPPPHAAGPAGGNVTAVGDSVMLGAVEALKEALPGASVNAVEGRQASEAFALLDTLVAKGHIGGEVILHIGTNGTIDPGALDALLTRLASRRVIMLNVHVPRPWQDLNNTILSAAARNHSNVRLVDWNAVATAHPDWLWDDGIHLRPSGAAAYRSLVIATLG